MKIGAFRSSVLECLFNSHPSLSLISSLLDLCFSYNVFADRTFLCYIEKQEEPDTFESLGSFIAGKEAGVTPGSELDDQLPDLNESSEPSRASRKGKCNLRKSLAWDNAFFTSAGIIWVLLYIC